MSQRFRPQGPLVEEWRCSIGNCRTLLAMKHAQGLIIIRYKDFSVEISGEDFSLLIPCRRCGARNRLQVSRTRTLLQAVEKETN